MICDKEAVEGVQEARCSEMLCRLCCPHTRLVACPCLMQSWQLRLMHCRLTTVPNGFSSRLKQALDDSEMLPKPYVSQCDGKQAFLNGCFQSRVSKCSDVQSLAKRAFSTRGLGSNKHRIRTCWQQRPVIGRTLLGLCMNSGMNSSMKLVLSTLPTGC